MGEGKTHTHSFFNGMLGVQCIVRIGLYEKLSAAEGALTSGYVPVHVFGRWS